MPLGIWTSSFDSSTIVSKIYEIIAQDSGHQKGNAVRTL